MAQEIIAIGAANAKAGDSLFSAFTKTQDNFTELYTANENTIQSIVVVNQGNAVATLGGVIDSTKVYYIDGIIDMGSTSITVPQTGITLRGGSFDLSGLTSSADNYTMFISESIATGSGSLLGFDYYISVTGGNSKVYELYDYNGFNAFEFQRVNYIDCTNLGDIYDYRQGLESGTGRFGGSPSLTLHGGWLGGYRITTSIVRNLAGTMTQPLFKGGFLFQMQSRFLSDINCDLPTLAPLFDFAPANFPNASTVQLDGCLISRGGVFNASDSNIIPNMQPSDLSAAWTGNVGISNTFVGGKQTATAESATVIAAGSTFYHLNATWTPSVLSHFDSPSTGRLRHIGASPIEFKIQADFTIEGPSGNEIAVRVKKWDDSTSGFLDFQPTTRPINALVGGRDVAFFTILVNIALDTNDYISFEVANNSGNGNVTLELDSNFVVEER